MTMKLCTLGGPIVVTDTESPSHGFIASQSVGQTESKSVTQQVSGKPE